MREVSPCSRRYHIVLEGAVRGVGCQPLIHRLASNLALAGYVQSSTEGVVIEVEGGTDRIQCFIDRLTDERPVTSLVTGWQFDVIATTGGDRFAIVGSQPPAAF